MTYCVGILTRAGLVFAADSRTNAGVDYVTTARKLKTFEVPGERVICVLAAGNLATTQAVLSVLGERTEARADGDSLFKVPTMFGVARIVGRALREVIATDGEHVRAEGADPSASFIVGGEIRGRKHRLFQVYNAGNFIEATDETPFLQIGETKYGKPILDRIIAPSLSLEDAARCALVSIDSTMRSNLSVGPPLDLMIYQRDSLQHPRALRYKLNSPYFASIRKQWGDGLRRLFDDLPRFDWEK